MAKICKSERGVNFDRITKTDKGKYRKEIAGGGFLWNFGHFLKGIHKRKPPEAGIHLSIFWALTLTPAPRLSKGHV